MVVGAADEAVSWRNLASHLHGESGQNAKDASLYRTTYMLTYDWILGQVVRCCEDTGFYKGDGTVLKAFRVAERETARRMSGCGIFRQIRHAQP